MPQTAILSRMLFSILTLSQESSHPPTQVCPLGCGQEWMSNAAQGSGPRRPNSPIRNLEFFWMQLSSSAPLALPRGPGKAKPGHTAQLISIQESTPLAFAFGVFFFSFFLPSSILLHRRPVTDPPGSHHRCLESDFVGPRDTFLPMKAPGLLQTSRHHPLFPGRRIRLLRNTLRSTEYGYKVAISSLPSTTVYKVHSLPLGSFVSIRNHTRLLESSILADISAAVGAFPRAKGGKCSSQELEDREHGRDLQSGASLASKFAISKVRVRCTKSKAWKNSGIFSKFLISRLIAAISLPHNLLSSRLTAT
ncbi:hypothetical protein BDP55DRAFT_125656 [Colletotrichum godetiae]|uniref:Uncharacterized protein n=1 Tax=Colletotrichum godetiae TaxID=1209918 RepID=A0AAJ0F4B3_9PEZI|nr:uncharacterized protein BDP55DRAFT_125656 [Colletotrichum godetiae]KAK1700291.1 hypothetical protein BDP55DRAFT_125656 [Colletotrichum godetiae]